MRRLVFFTIWCFAACSPEAERPRSSNLTLFEGARLIAGDGRVPIEESAFLVENDQISRIGARGEIPIQEGAARVDLTGKTVMPLLVAIHAHLGYDREATFSAENYTRETIADQLDRLLYYGVGTVLSLGLDTGELAFQVQEAQRSGGMGGAELRTAGRGFVAVNGGPTLTFEGKQPLRHVPYEVDSADEARKLVQDLAAKKVDMIKIWVDDRLGTVPKLRPEVYRAIIEEAHQRGIRVMAHVYYLNDAKDLVRSGVDGFAHLVRDREIDDELVALMKEHDVFTVTAFFQSPPGAALPSEDPTLLETVPPRLLPKAAPPAGEAASRRSGMERISAHNLAKLKAAGIRIGLGADSGLPSRWLGYTDNHQLELMVRAGMTPAEAIVAATRTSAEILGLNDRGTLASGKRADFIVLDANPLEDVASTRRIAGVYQKGRRLDRASLRKRWTGGGTS